MLILDVEPVDKLPDGFRHGFGPIRPENGPTLTDSLTFAH